MRVVCEIDKIVGSGIEALGKLRQDVGVRRALIIILNETDVRTLEPRIGSSLPLLVLYKNGCSPDIIPQLSVEVNILM